jgi:hypothetical protein
MFCTLYIINKVRSWFYWALRGGPSPKIPTCYVQASVSHDVECKLWKWIFDNIPSELINEIPKIHSTIIYGCCDDDEYIKNKLDGLKSRDITLTLTSKNLVYGGDYNKDMIYLDFKSPELDLIRSKFVNDKYINCDGIHSSYTNHFTLAWMVKDAHKDDRIKELLTTNVVNESITCKLTLTLQRCSVNL